MSKLQPNKTGTRAARRALNFASTRALVALAVVFAFALCTLATAASASAQSRRAPRPAATPTPEPTPETAAPQGESESESKPRGGAKTKEAGVVVSFLILEDDNQLLSIDYTARDDIRREFLQRLGRSRAVSVAQGGRATRSEARKRAKSERETYVVVFQMEEGRDDGMGDAGVGRVDTRYLILRTYVYAPNTGDLKYADTIYQRPYRDTATIGGVRIPVPGGRRMERYPSQRQLEQAARDAADRLMSHFNVILPPDNE